MDFIWTDCYFDLKKTPPREIEETFEDPFAIRLLPEGKWIESEARYICLGKTLNNKALLSIFWTDGKKFRVIACREATDKEQAFYERKLAESL